MTQDQIMELVQVYASAWALVGSRFDNGNGMADALEAKAAVVAAIEAQTTEIERLQREVVNRNQRALDGDLAVKVRDAEFLVNDKLREQIAALTKDAERLDHIQVTGSTVELVNFGQKPVQHSFRVGGLYKAINFDLRLAIDAAIAAQEGTTC